MVVLPIVCTLTEPELRERRDGLLRRVRERVVAARQLPAPSRHISPPPGEAAAPAGRSTSAGATGMDTSAPAADVAESALGFELRFAGDEATVADVLELVRLESRCCAFLRFRVTLEPAAGPVVVEITGPPGSAELLAAELVR